MADEFEEGLKNLVSEQFKDGEAIGLRDPVTGKFADTGDNGNGDEDEEADKDRREKDDNAEETEIDAEEVENDSQNDEEVGEKDDDEGEEVADEKKPDKMRWSRRVDKLTSDVKRLEKALRDEREGREAAARAPKKADGTPYKSGDEYARDKLTSDEKAPKKPKADAKDADGKPLYKLGEFDECYREDYDDYLEARRDFLTEKRGEFEKGSSTSATDAAAASQQEFQTKLNSAIEVGKKAYKDFDEKVVKGIEKDAWPLSEAGAHFLVDSEVGADLAYHLATNVKVAKEIANLSPVQQIKRFTKLEDQFVAAAAERAKKAKRGSSAPEPIREKARGGGRSDSNRFDSEDFSSVEKNWNATAAKQKR